MTRMDSDRAARPDEGRQPGLDEPISLLEGGVGRIVRSATGERMRRLDHMAYQRGQQQLGSDIQARVLETVAATDVGTHTSADVRQALRHRTRTVEDFAALLSPAADAMLEEVAAAAQRETRDRFGTQVNVFTPLYIANYCQNLCTYCGFSATNQIRRAKLDDAGIEQEMAAIAATGLEEILILTGESAKHSGVDYIAEACTTARRYFRTVGIEVQPMNVDDYAKVHGAGADFVSVYQETYDPETYDREHPWGHKRSYPYRFESQERALLGGMRGVSFGALFGLHDYRKDALATGLHAYHVQRRYPHAEISFSCPRLRPVIGQEGLTSKDVHERQLLQIMCAYRLFMPFASITVSTRERARFRDNVIGLVATKVSAGVSTGVGAHADGLDEGDDQFEISDERTVDEVCAAIRARGLQPVLNDYVAV